MKRTLIICLLLCLLAVSLCACGTETPAPAETPAAEPAAPVEVSEEPAEEPEPAPVEAPVEETPIVLAEIRDEMIETLSIADPFLLETDALLHLYGITADTVAESASFVTMTGTFPDEIILVNAVNETAAETVRELLQRRLDEVMVQSQSYDQENYESAQKCLVRCTGCYVSLILSPEQEAMASIYEAYISE